MTGVDGAPAPASSGASLPAERPQSLLASPFRALWLETFLLYGLDAILRAIVPIIALDRGGDAVLVGLLGTAFAIPSVIFRPIVGSLVDSWHHRLLLRSAALGVAVLPLILLLPGSLPLLVGRFVYGSSFAAFSVSNHALLAKLAPPTRRAEASGGYLTTGGIGALILPGLAVALYTANGDLTPILFAMLLGLAGVATVARIAVPAAGPASGSPAAAEPPRSLFTRFFEPSAVPGTILLITSYSAWSIFTVFPPVYAQHVGEPTTVLIAYFPIFGLAQVLVQPFVGRLGDRLGRARSMTVGAALAAAGLLVALVPGFTAFTVAAVTYAVAQAFVIATISALTMERAPRNRLGSAMATYSIGYQVATGISSLVWGAMITTVGFTWLFAAALGLQLLAIGLTRALLVSR